MTDHQNFTPQITKDGSFTFFSAEFGETFHSHFGAKQEAEFKFVEPTQLRQQAKKSNLKILDICYGLGYNTAAALETIWQVNPNCYIEWMGLELDIAVPKSAIAHHLLDNWYKPIPEILRKLAEEFWVKTDRLQAQLLIGDARITIAQVHQSGFFADAVFLDPFSPPSCPQLWTVEFLALVAKCLKPDGRLATYSCSAAVRQALIEVGLQIGSTSPVGRRSPGTVASMNADLPPLSQQEQEHLQTKAAIPYRDPNLCDPVDIILQRRQTEQQVSPLEPTSHWKKRWLQSVQRSGSIN
jgi:tRNA U34 5-methylaminomethyl-2-thiouridine-forming methyltransferase MnmC